MRVLKIAAALALCAQLSGCWFVFIPGSLIQKASDAITGDVGRHCGPEGTKVGDVLPLPNGGTATVTAVSGPSAMCTKPASPIRVQLEFSLPKP